MDGLKRMDEIHSTANFLAEWTLHFSFSLGRQGIDHIHFELSQHLLPLGIDIISS
jgi:hypothetical protein